MSRCCRVLLVFTVSVAISCVTVSSSNAQGWLNQAKKLGGKVSSSVKTETRNFSNSASKVAPNGISTGKLSPFSSSENYSHLGRTDDYSPATNSNYKPIGINPYAGANSNPRPGVTHKSFADLQRDLKAQQQITAEKQRQATIAMNQKNVQLIGQSIQAIGQIAQRNQLRREREQFEQQRAAFQQQQQQFVQNQNQGFQQGYTQPNYQQQAAQPQQMQYQQSQRPVVQQQQVRRPLFRQAQPAMAPQQGMVQQSGQVVYQHNGQMQPQMVQQQGRIFQRGFSQPQPQAVQHGTPVYQQQAYQQPVQVFGRR